MNGKETVLSGIRATGNLHLGNYFGALSKFVRMQRDYDCLYFVADLHALTTNPDPEQLHRNVRSIVAEYLAAGLDPEESTLSCRAMCLKSPRCICCSTCMWA